MKDMPLFGAPLIFNCAKDGGSSFSIPQVRGLGLQGPEAERTIAGNSELFKPLQKMGRGIVSTAAHILASGDLVLVAFQNPDPNARKTADVFQGGKQIGAVEFPGRPTTSTPRAGSISPRQTRSRASSVTLSSGTKSGTKSGTQYLFTIFVWN